MPDVHATITQQPRALVENIATAMETRAASPQQRAMLEAYLAHVGFPPLARVLEVGCGTGPVSGVLARRPGVGEVIGVDPSPVLLERARALRGGIPNLSFQEGDARALPVEDASFDVVVIHTVLSHIPGPEAALVEAFRVLRAGGWLAVFDGDYATLTASAGPADPLGACVEAFKASFIHDLWLVRRLPRLASAAGFGIVRFDSHGYVETTEPGYMLTVIDRGADALVADGSIAAELAAALKAEARRRAGSGAFFGHVAYASLVARRP